MIKKFYNLNCNKFRFCLGEVNKKEVLHFLFEHCCSTINVFLKQWRIKLMGLLTLLSLWNCYSETGYSALCLIYSRFVN